MYYSFDVNAAARYGVEEAVLLEHIRFWCEKNAANPDCRKEGRCWMYASAARLAEHFPFWSVSKIRRLLKSLVRQGALLEGRFGRFAFDRTLWYAISETALSMFQNRHLQKTNPEYSTDDSARAIKDTQKDTQEDSQHTYTACGGGRAPSPLFEKSGNATPKAEREQKPMQADAPIAATPASPAQTASQPAHIAPAAQNTQAPAGFERFWQAYPRKADKRAALLAWKALRPDETLVNTMLAALATQCESAPWKESGGRYIPHPAKWLSHRRWEDAAPMAQAPRYSMQPWAQQTSRPFDPAAAVDILARHRPRRLKRLEA